MGRVGLQPIGAPYGSSLPGGRSAGRLRGVSGDQGWRTPGLSRVLAGCALALGAVTACSSEPVAPVTDEPWVALDEIAYCTPGETGDADFWDLVHASCEVAQDGDLRQAEALREVLEDSSDDEVARFHRELVRANRALRPAARVADEVCAPGLGLGADLGADFRSWVIAHGQSAYESVLADPESLHGFPDLEIGCGRGEPFGYAAYRLYLERTGLSPGQAGLPSL